MAAHLRSLVTPRCLVCDRPATKELRDTRNQPINTYCGRHAKSALQEFKRVVGER